MRPVILWASLLICCAIMLWLTVVVSSYFLFLSIPALLVFIYLMNKGSLPKGDDRS